MIKRGDLDSPFKKKPVPATAAPAAAPTAADAEIDALIANSALEEKKKLKRKKTFKLGVYGGIGLLLALGCWYLFAPFKGGMAFGICKVFLELSVQYPEMLKLSTVEEMEDSVRIWYTQLDSFGQYRMEPIQCFFKNDETQGTILSKVMVRRREVDPAIVDKFNKSIPTILANPPDLTLPTPLPDSLRSLQIDPLLYMRPIF
jgi:hypothetical protein